MRAQTLLLPLFLLAALGCNSSSPAEPAPRDGGSASVDAQVPALDGGGFPDVQAPPSCYTNPTTYLEIINACTDAEAIDKQVDLSPMNLADGGLQPLP